VVLFEYEVDGEPLTLGGTVETDQAEAVLAVWQKLRERGVAEHQVRRVCLYTGHQQVPEALRLAKDAFPSAQVDTMPSPRFTMPFGPGEDVPWMVW
jgi:hypothetical protein